MLLDVGFPARVPAMVVAGIGLLLVGMGSTGYSVLTETDTAWVQTPEFSGFRHPAPSTP